MLPGVQFPEDFFKKRVSLPGRVLERLPGVAVISVVAEDTGFDIQKIRPLELTHRREEDDVCDFGLVLFAVNLPESAQIRASGDQF